MTEKEKMLKGLIYDANRDAQLIAERMECKKKCREYNDAAPDDMARRRSLLDSILGDIAGDVLIEQPFYCDYGYNISVGHNFFANFNVTILDEAPVNFGDNCVIGAGSVVVKDVPANCMAAGNPCKFIKPID
ncbi:MAG: hypothetical protein K2L55_06425 [Muribaculaceae bacterium]|nr:hypothetical protein [Muribaculaceae bacterium]MDE6346288.1 hypothetical protein [Muribaculaceae bacterium]